MTDRERAYVFLTGIPGFAEAERTQVRPLDGVVSLNNHVFRVEHRGEAYILRLAARGCHRFSIRRDEELAALTAAAAAGIAPPLVFANADGDLLCRHVAGRHWSREDCAAPGNAGRLGALIRDLHRVDLGGRPGVAMIERVARMHATARELRCELPDGLERVIDRCRERQAAAGSASCLNHNDLWLNNLIDDGRRLWAVDWEFAGPGDGLHDLDTALLSTGYADGLRREFLQACGRDPHWVEAHLPGHRRMVHLFEGLWAAIQHAVRGSAQHDYQGMARSHLGGLASAPG